MFCAECGKEIADNAPVCPECGAVQTQQAEEPAAGTENPVEENPEQTTDADFAADDGKEKREKKKPKAALLIAAVAILLCLVLAAAANIIRVFSSKNFGKNAENPMFSWVTYTDYTDPALTDGKTLIVPAKSPSDVITLEGVLQRVFYNTDRSVSGVVLGTDNVLYRIENGKEAFIEENVADVSFSANGKGLAFTTGTYRADNTERTDLYLRSGTKNERISRDCAGTVVFSPSGKYILYTEYDGKNHKLLLHNGKKAKEILSSKRRITALGIRDDGKRMYYAVKDTNGDQLQGAYTLYHYDSESFEELGGFSFGNRILFNRDLSQILFTDDKNAWFSENGQEPVKLRMAGNDLQFVTPEQTAVQWGYDTLEPDLYDVKDFRNTFLQSGDTLYLFTGAEFKTVSRNVSDAQVLHDEKTLLIRKTDGGLFRMNGKKENAKEEALASDDIDLYGASPDGKTVYYITKNAELYLYRKKEGPLKLSGEKGVDAYVDPETGKISHTAQIAYREKSAQLYFVEGGMLYVAAKDGTVTAPAYGMEGDVSGVSCYRELVWVSTFADGVSRVYLGTDGETFTLLTEDGTISQ